MQISQRFEIGHIIAIAIFTSSHTIAIYSLIVNENLIQCCLHPDKVMKVFCTPLIPYRSCRHVSNFALGCQHVTAKA